MYPTIKSNTGIYVNKVLLGSRIYTKFEFDSSELHSVRLPGLRKLRVGDVAVFNYPFGWGKDKIEFKINYVYVKRCIGIPGDSISIVKSHYINSRTGFTGIPKSSEITLSGTSDKILLEFNLLKAGQFANKVEDWTIKDFGPILVPGKGINILMNNENFTRYAKVIEYETGEKISISEGIVTLGKRQIQSYTFSENWYFFAGDNVINSRDSRYFGFVPEDFVIGIVPKYSCKLK